MLEKLNKKFEKLELFDENFGLSINEILRKIAKGLGVEYDGGEIKVERNDREYRLFIYHAERGCRVAAPPFFEIKTKTPCPHPYFGIKKSDSLDWLAEHFLFKTDYQVGDADFDAKFNIRVEEENWGGRFFSHSSTRKGLSDLLLQGFDVIRSEDGEIKAAKYLTIDGPYPEVEMIDRAIELLDQVMSNFPNDYEPVSTNNYRNDTDLFNYSADDMAKDLKEANNDLVFGDMDEKSKRRTRGVVIIVLILAAFAYGRLFLFHMVSDAPPLNSPSLKSEVDSGFYFYIIYTFFLIGVFIYAILHFVKGRKNRQN